MSHLKIPFFNKVYHSVCTLTTPSREADKGGITLQLATTKDFNGVAIDCYVEREGDGDFWASREQIGRLLEYAEPMKSVAKIHERNNERLDKYSTIVKLTTVEESE